MTEPHEQLVMAVAGQIREGFKSYNEADACARDAVASLLRMQAALYPVFVTSGDLLWMAGEIEATR